MRPESRVANRTMLRKLIVVSVLMFGFGWALIPLYRKICEITGVNVLTSRNTDAERAARNTQVDTSRTVIVEFDANKQGAWRFKPHQNFIDPKLPGDVKTITLSYTFFEVAGTVAAAR